MVKRNGIEITESPMKRGKIKKIIMEIEYPDNSSIVAYYNEKWLDKTGAILFHESCMTEEQRKSFYGTEDWEMNPTFLRWKRGKNLGDYRCLNDGNPCDHCCYCREHKQR